MKDLVEYIIKQIVNNPDAVQAEEKNEEGTTTVTLSVDPQDMGMVIGKNGQTIKAIRKVLTIRAMIESVRVNLYLNDPQGNDQRPEVSN